MATATARHIEAAKQVLAQESASGGNPEARAAAAAGLYGTLFRAFAPLIGAAGFRALFARSVKLTKTEFPCLAEILVTTEAPESKRQVEERLVDCLSKLEPETALKVATGLYATLFGIMATFIGERLVWQVVKRAFPAIDESDPKETE